MQLLHEAAPPRNEAAPPRDTATAPRDETTAPGTGEAAVPTAAPGALASEGVATHCPYCALQCGMTLRWADHGNEIEVQPRASHGKAAALCRKGWTSAELLTSPERLRTPLVRSAKDDELREATWKEAMDAVIARIEGLRAEHGRDAVGVFGGGGLTNEKAYALGKFARAVLGTRFIDYNGRFCMSSAAAAGQRAFGLDRGLPFPASDIDRAGAVLLAGGNVAETMPPFAAHFTAMRKNGGALIVIDPRETETARQADLHLQPTPGTDLPLALGLLHLLIVEGRLDTDYIAERTTGFDAVRRIALSYWPARVERSTGVPVSDLTAAARTLGDAAGAIVLTARGAEQHVNGTDTVSAFVNLALALGLPGTPGSGYGCLTGQGNGQGGREHGQKADQLPGYRRLDDPDARAYVAGVWGVDPETLPEPGPSAYEMLSALGTDGGEGARLAAPRGLLVFGSNPVVSAPRAAAVERGLRCLDLLVVCDLVLSETAALADVVLPAAQWAEEDGTMTDLEGRVLRRRRLTEPPDAARPDLAVLSELADRLGAGTRVSADAREMFGELGRASAGGAADYAGIDYDRLDAGEDLHWPCPEPGHPGTPRMFLDRFAHPDGRARFVPVEWSAPVPPEPARPSVPAGRPEPEGPSAPSPEPGSAPEQTDAEYPLLLTTGRVLEQYQTGAQTRRVASLADAVPSAYVEIHPDLAARHDIADGETVRVASRRGVATAPARVTASIRPDTVFMPFHWGGDARVNTLTDPTLDPVSAMPEFKVCAVRLEGRR